MKEQGPSVGVFSYIKYKRRQFLDYWKEVDIVIRGCIWAFFNGIYCLISLAIVGIIVGILLRCKDHIVFVVFGYSTIPLIIFDLYLLVRGVINVYKKIQEKIETDFLKWKKREIEEFSRKR